MEIGFVILAFENVLLAIWSLWLLWDRKKKIQAISNRREAIRALKRERDVWMKAAKGVNDAEMEL